MGTADSIAVIAVVAVTAMLTVALYFAPSLLAYARRAPDAGKVLIINVLAGWSGIGWLIALLLAMRDPPVSSPVQVISTVVNPPSWRDPITRGLAGDPGRPGETPPPLQPGD